MGRCPGGDGHFSARDWDLQVPHSPRGALQRCPPTQDLRPALTRGVHMAQLLLSSLVLYCPSPCSGADLGQQELSRGWHTRTHAPPAPSPAPRAPLPWQHPHGTRCAWDPPSWPHISCQVFSNKYSRAMQGCSWDPPRFEQPLHPSWNCCPLSPRGPPPALAPRPVPAPQRPLLNQRRARGVPGDYLSPCSREELGESRVPAPPAWGHAGSGRLAARGHSFPKAWEDRWEFW